MASKSHLLSSIYYIYVIYIYTMFILYIEYFILIHPVLGGMYENRDQIGTVLFSESDNMRTCWSDEHIAMLTSRMYFEDLLPASNMFNIQDDNFINALIEYFQMVTDTVKRSTEGKAKHVLLTSLCDCLGGYLHHTALPLGRHAYYSGNINYDSMEKIYDLYNEIKEFLRTDGKSWATPLKDFSQFENKVLPLPIVTQEDASSLPCQDIVYYENEDGGRNKLSIPLPFFDSNSNPHAIAVPYRNRSLRNVEGKPSAFVLVKYYTDAVKCFINRNANKGSLTRFYQNFSNWIKQHVLPRTSDDRFYSAFGGIYRLEETLKRNLVSAGLIRPEVAQFTKVETKPKYSQAPPKYSTLEPGGKSRKRSVVNNYYSPNENELNLFDLPKKRKEQFAYFEEPSFWDEDFKSGNNTEEEIMNTFWNNINWDMNSTTTIILFNILIIVIFLWFCVGILYLCYRTYRKNENKIVCEDIIGDQAKRIKPKKYRVNRKRSDGGIKKMEWEGKGGTVPEYPPFPYDPYKCYPEESFNYSDCEPIGRKKSFVNWNKLSCNNSYDTSPDGQYPMNYNQVHNSYEDDLTHTSMCMCEDAQSKSSRKLEKPVVYGYEYYSSDTSCTGSTSCILRSADKPECATPKNQTGRYTY